MELVNGRTLEQELVDRGPLPAEEISRIDVAVRCPRAGPSRRVRPSLGAIGAMHTHHIYYEYAEGYIYNPIGRQYPLAAGAGGAVGTWERQRVARPARSGGE